MPQCVNDFRGFYLKNGEKKKLETMETVTYTIRENPRLIW